MVETVEDILRVTWFIAAGGLVAIVFFFMFAQTIIGNKSVHQQIQRLIDQNRLILDELRELNRKTGKAVSSPKTDKNTKSES